MAFVKVRVPRTSQPQDAARISSEYGEVFSYLPSRSLYQDNNGKDLVVYGSSSSRVVDSDGYALEMTSNADSLCDPDIRTPSEFCVVIRFKNLSANTNGIFMAGKFSFGRNEGWMIDNSGTDYFEINSGSSGFFPKVYIPGIGAADGRWHTLAVHYMADKAWVGFDGVIFGPAATKVPPGASPYGVGILNYPANNVEGNRTNRRLSMAAIITKNIDVASLSANPWQIFEPEELTIWIPDAVGAGGAATVIPIGVQANSAIGTPAAIGAAIAALTGVSATGSVGSPTATGGASIPATASPSGVSASSAVGTPAAKGAAKALPAGVQATSAVGTPLVIGGSSIPATVLPAGVAGLAYVGSPVATGQARAYPLGVQATGAVGSPVVTAGGSAVAQPQGVAASSSVGAPVARGAAVAYPLGLAGYWSVGQPVAIGQSAMPATAYPAGVSATGYVGTPVAFEASDATPSIHRATSPAQSYTATSPAQIYTATSPAQSYTAVVPAQIYST